MARVLAVMGPVPLPGGLCSLAEDLAEAMRDKLSGPLEGPSPDSHHGIPDISEMFWDSG